MAEVKICQYGKEIKKRLVDIDKTQVWLISQVAKDTGLYFDRSYLHKVMAGKNNNPKIKASIVIGIKMSYTSCLHAVLIKRCANQKCYADILAPWAKRFNIVFDGFSVVCRRM